MKQARGFTLIELAIVLVIMTILIGGLAMPLSAQIQARRIGETKKTLEEAREAVLGYAMTHPATATATNRHLPCPDTTGDGKENRGLTADPDACMANSGWFPWVTLGTAPQDAWGNRLRYAVNTGDLSAPSMPSFAHRSTGFSVSTGLAGALQICTTHTCTTPDVASNVVFVLVSHGPNGWGARNVNGNTLASPTSSHELENQDGDNLYVSRAPTQPDNASGEFDDLVVWVSHAHLIARVCPTGCLPP
jgi:prepilin-type N-terminal cleavage/methylation domain-containing protein